MDGQSWLKNLGTALSNWLDHTTTHTYETLESELGIDRRTLRRVMNGEYFIAEKTDPNFYAKLYRITRLSESDPRTIPNDGRGHSRAWTDERLNDWWVMYYPQDVQISADNHMQESPSPFVEFVFKELTSLLEDSVDSREIFYQQNHRTIEEIIRLLQVLNQPQADREESISLMGVFHK